MSLVDDAVEALSHVTASLPSGGETRQGQIEMLQAVAGAIEDERHLIAQAGTGTGKSFAYLIPVILSGKRTVIATATKALQDQIAGAELPHLRSQLERGFSWAVLKGRNNYICRQRVNEFSNDAQLSLAGTAAHNEDEVERLVEFSDSSSTGDRAELDFEPADASWSAVSVSSRECPGRKKCPSGENCFAEMARDRANAADVIVINTHLLGIDMVSENGILPEHDVVVVDEAHQLADIATSSFGWNINGARMRWFARTADRILVDPEMIDKLRDVGDDISDALEPHVGNRLPPTGDEDILIALDRARDRVNTAVEKLRNIPSGKDSDADARAQRALQAGTTLLGELIEASAVDDSNVAWVERSMGEPTLQVAPLDVASTLGPALVENRTAILTSATLAQATATTVGLEDGNHDRVDVESPFDYQSNALLYCATQLPEPRSPDYEKAMLTHMVELISAAGGRTLGLFTSWRMMDTAAEFLETYIKTPILTQRDYPKPVLIEKFREDPETTLLATLGFWQGIDVPGPSLSLVTIDRLPFPRPDDPLLSARLDSRLATKKSYRWELIKSLPDFARTSDPEDVLVRLRAIVEATDERADEEE